MFIFLLKFITSGSDLGEKLKCQKIKQCFKTEIRKTHILVFMYHHNIKQQFFSENNKHSVTRNIGKSKHRIYDYLV